MSEPIADWYGRVVEPVLAIHYNARARAQHGALAEFAEAALGSRMFVRQVSQTSNRITTMADATMQAAIDRYVERYVRMYVLQIIRFVARVLSHLGSAAQAKGLQEIPYLDEYFYLFRCDDAEMKSRKTWSFYRP